MSAQERQVVDSTPLSSAIDYEFLGDSETVRKKQRAVEGYRLKASLYHAAQFAGCARASIYRWLDSDPLFAQAIADAHEDAADVMETSTYEDALGTEDKPGNALLKMFWLKAHRPKYRDKVQVDLNSVQEQIDMMVQRMDPRQLPAVMTDFIGTEFNTSTQEYQPVESNTLQFSSNLDNEQKEESPQSTPASD